MVELLDTIAAISTPEGEGGIGIIRISGPDAAGIADRLFLARSGRPLSKGRGYSMRLGTITAGGYAVDDALALLFRAPKSYTGEDVVELQCHGGPVLLAGILRALVDAGARVAEAGEFTRRAFLNGRLSLTEAEGIAGMISAVSKQGEAAAFALSRGTLFRETERLRDSVLEVQSAIAAWIDFPEEDVEAVENDRLMGHLESLAQSLKTLVDSYETGLFVLNGVPTAIVGSPNVGKSTLMNLIAGYEKAIVTPVAGTTRDVVEQQVRLGGTTLLLADTAGIRDSDDLVEQIGIEKAIDRIEQSALVLAVFDSSRSLSEDDRELIKKLRGKRAVAIVNKMDLETKLDLSIIESAFDSVVYISATDPKSLKMLDDAVAKLSKTDRFSPDAPMLMNERQRSAAVRALNSVEEAFAAAKSGMTLDVVFISLDEALAAILELSGENVSEAVIDEVFRRFCVGK